MPSQHLNFAVLTLKLNTMLNPKTIGNKISEARKRCFLSQSQLAQHIPISPQAVGKWERGESLPDIITLNRLAEILEVDLNYFSGLNTANDTKHENNTDLNIKPAETVAQNKKPNWDMSGLNLADSDFSGLKNLHEKFCSSNMQRCLFVGSDLSGLSLNKNNIESCDFTGAGLNNSKIHGSNLNADIFRNTSLQKTEFYKTNIFACDFSGADLGMAVFKMSNFMKNTVTDAKWNKTSFVDMQIQDVVFEGAFEECYFENCSFYGVKFMNVTLTNTFFKNNRKLKKVQFDGCKADKLTYAFLKNNLANLSGITLIA